MKSDLNLCFLFGNSARGFLFFRKSARECCFPLKVRLHMEQTKCHFWSKKWYPLQSLKYCKMMKKGRRPSKLKWEVFGYLEVKISSSEISTGCERCQKFLLLQNPGIKPIFTKNVPFLKRTLIFDVQERAGGQKIFFGKTRLEDLRKNNDGKNPKTHRLAPFRSTQHVFLAFPAF